MFAAMLGLYSGYQTQVFLCARQALLFLSCIPAHRNYNLRVGVTLAYIKYFLKKLADTLLLVNSENGLLSSFILQCLL